MTLPGARAGVHYVIAAVWLAVTVSIASWWLSVGLTLTNRHRMFVWEGGTFIVLLVAGGLAILVAIRREHRRRQALETFFMSFTHDLKTSLASVQLQAEGLREDAPDSGASAPLDRLLHDMVRLQIQLENSLFVAQPDGRLLREQIDAAATFGRLAQDWPELDVRVDGNAVVLADARAFDAICRNLLQNAVVHGAATCVDVTATSTGGGRSRLTVRDNGIGVPAATMPTLGEAFGRRGPTSGTGVGLFVCRQLASRMGGTLAFLPRPDSARGLTVVLELPGGR
ncbi:MAG: HAMP domain-containing sensor histidine kinase [Vicinamibacterales bacterium]